MLLSDFLRHSLGLTGTHVGCEQGVCGACTVLMDGQPARSCLTFAVQANGHEVETVEGCRRRASWANPGGLSVRARPSVRVLYAGVPLSTKAFLEERSEPTVEEIREYMSGNVCRCTGYQGIVKAVQKAAELRKEAEHGA